MFYAARFLNPANESTNTINMPKFFRPRIGTIVFKEQAIAICEPESLSQLCW